MNRSTKLLIALLLVLAAIAYFLLPSEKERETSYTAAQLSLKVDSASIVKIEILRPSKPVVIENVGGKWTITAPGRYPADSKSIFQLLNGFNKFNVGSLVSSNPEKQSLFQVDSSGTRLTFTERSGKSVSLIVGKMGPSFSEIYFRLPGSKDVYLGDGIETWTVNKDMKDWRDKTIYAAQSEMIKEITYSLGGKGYTFSRDTSGWKLADKSVEAGTMNPLLTTLSSLHADDFADTISRIDLNPVTIGIKGPEDITLNLYPSLPDSSKYFVQSSASQQMFIISKWTAQQLLKPVEKPGVPPAQAVREVAASPKVKTEEHPPAPVVTEQKEAKPSVPKHSTPKTAAKQEGEKKPPVSQPLTPKVEPKREAEKTNPPSRTKEKEPAAQTQNPLSKKDQGVQKSQSGSEEEGELTVHTVQKGETMTAIAKKYNVTPEQIIKWNLLKTIAVKPGQELYIYVRK